MFKLIKEIPNDFYKSVPNITTLILHNNKIIHLTNSISELKFLKVLKLDFNLIKILPRTIGEMNNLEILSISHNLLVAIPSNISKLCSTIKILNISDNKIKYLPNELGSLINLRELYINNNILECIPNSLSFLKLIEKFSLEWIDYLPKREKTPFLFTKIAKVCASLLEKNVATCTYMNFAKYYGFTKVWINSFDSKTGFTYFHKAAYGNHLPILRELLSISTENIDSVDFSS